MGEIGDKILPTRFALPLRYHQLPHLHLPHLLLLQACALDQPLITAAVVSRSRAMSNVAPTKMLGLA